MENNKKQIKNINRLAIIQELIEKTKNCSLYWVETSLGQYRTQFSNYSFYLTKTSPTVYNLDVIKNNDLYTAYNSLIQSNVKNLYETVEILSSNSVLNKSRRINEFLGRKGSCRQGEIGSSNKLYSIVPQSFGLRGSGVVVSQVLRQKFLYFNPSEIDFDGEYPWAGSHLDIDEFDVFNQNDGDQTYIRQQVSGERPTNWGYCDIKFNLASLPQSSPFIVIGRVAARRETEPGVSLIISLIINNQTVYQQTIELNESYTNWETGQTFLDDSFSKINDITIKLVTFTNSGNLLPRAVRVTGVDLGIYGFDPI